MGKKITYIDTYNHDGLTYNDYLEYCDEEDWTPGDEDSEEYYEWLWKETEFNVECTFDNIKYSKVCNRPCVISGTLGLWNGNHDIYLTMCNNLLTAIKKCWGSANDLIMELEDGVVTVQAMHHDGTNSFEIRLLTNEGAELMENGEDIDIEKHTEKYPGHLY
jgi:hypothetical protein